MQRLVCMYRKLSVIYLHHSWAIILISRVTFPFQCPQTLGGCNLRGSGPDSWLSHGNVHLLCGLFCGLSFLLCQHICGSNYHHFPGAGRQGHVGVQSWEEWGRENEMEPVVSCTASLHTITSNTFRKKCGHGHPCLFAILFTKGGTIKRQRTKQEHLQILLNLVRGSIVVQSHQCLDIALRE